MSYFGSSQVSPEVTCRLRLSSSLSSSPPKILPHSFRSPHIPLSLFHRLFFKSCLYTIMLAHLFHPLPNNTPLLSFTHIAPKTFRFLLLWVYVATTLPRNQVGNEVTAQGLQPYQGWRGKQKLTTITESGVLVNDEASHLLSP